MTSLAKTHIRSLARAVGQICLRMDDDPDGVFHLALPEDEYYKKKIRSLQVPLKKLGVRTFFVDSKGNMIEQ